MDVSTAASSPLELGRRPPRARSARRIRFVTPPTAGHDDHRDARQRARTISPSLRIGSGPPTDVPPNFWTIIGRGA
jgi:hypothetical protein